MTELHHGSNVAALQTEAVLDVATDEWIINTPDDGALKWRVFPKLTCYPCCLCMPIYIAHEGTAELWNRASADKPGLLCTGGLAMRQRMGERQQCLRG